MQKKPEFFPSKGRYQEKNRWKQCSECICKTQGNYKGIL